MKMSKPSELYFSQMIRSQKEEDRVAMISAEVLTEQTAIEKHRAIWNWIADRLEEDLDIGWANYQISCLPALKIRAISVLYPTDLSMVSDYGHCYLCCYTGVNCSRCPLNDGRGVANDCLGGRYELLLRAIDDNNRFWNKYYLLIQPEALDVGFGLNIYRKVISIVREIANLPERKEDTQNG